MACRRSAVRSRLAPPNSKSTSSGSAFFMPIGFTLAVSNLIGFERDVVQPAKHYLEFREYGDPKGTACCFFMFIIMRDSVFTPPKSRLGSKTFVLFYRNDPAMARVHDCQKSISVGLCSRHQAAFGSFGSYSCLWPV